MDKILSSTIQNIVNRIESIEKELDKHKKNLTEHSITQIEPKLFIKGKYLNFNTERQALEILVNGEVRYYSIKDYYSKYLPFPDSTVVIFSELLSDGEISRILATYRGEIEEFAEHKKFIFKGIKDNKAIFYSQDTGYVNFIMDINLFSYYKIRTTDKILFRVINFGTSKYFIPILEKKDLKLNKLEILKILKES